MTSTILPRSKLTSNLAGWQGGEGPPLLLIHGVGLRAEAWSPMLPILTRHFAVTAVDLPGHGESAILQGGLESSLDEFTGRIAQQLPDPSQKVLVMGHSLGALIALDLAIKHVDYGVKAEDYDKVGASLLRTLSKGLGDEFTPDVEAAWTDAYGVLSGVMKSAAYPAAA